MKSFCVGLTVLGLVIILPAARGVDDAKYRLHVRDGFLYRGTSRYRFRAIEIPDLCRVNASSADVARAYNQVSAAGANSLCFYLCGLAEDGSVLSPEGEKAVRVMAQQARGRYMSAICRLFSPSGPRGAEYRMDAVRAVAGVLKDEYRLLYWIDGPNSANLVREFKKIAPDLTVAAPEGGDVVVLEKTPEGEIGGPALLVGETPGEDLGQVSFLLLAGQTPYAVFETMCTDPIESEPWKPDNSVLSAEERGDGWIALFDGKSLSGWCITGSSKDGFIVRDGIIEWNERGGGVLRSRDRYENFILRLEWKIEQGGNSGIFLHAPRANRASRIGMEFQLRGDYGGAPSTGSTGAIYDVLPPTTNAGEPAGEWNEVEIMLDRTYLKATLNGRIVQDIDFGEHEEMASRLRRGFIGLQDHGNYVAFRNIRIRKL